MGKWIVATLAGTGLIITLVILFGLTRPVGHTARTQATYAVTPDVLWDTLTHFESWPEWYPEIEAVRRLPDRNGRPTLELTSSWGRVPAELVVFEAPARMQTSLDAGSFRGSWTYALTPSANGTLLTVTESGEVDNPVFRALMVLMDQHATMMQFHRALARRLGVDAVPQPVQVDGPEAGASDE